MSGHSRLCQRSAESLLCCRVKHPLGWSAITWQGVVNMEETKQPVSPQAAYAAPVVYAGAPMMQQMPMASLRAARYALC